jgi:transposase
LPLLSIVNTLIPPDVSIVQILPEADKIVLIARPKNLVSYCPSCGYASRRVHSHYLRRFADLPWHGRVVEIHLHARRFRCDNLHCQRRIFTERLAETVQPRARRTVRLGESQRAIGFATGGEPGSRLSRKLAMPVSGDTLLRMICRAAVEPFPPPRVVGIDDWAWRKGQRYGTIVCDLERNRVIDLLPDREAGTVAAWLKQYPGIEIVARDRAGFYADGASRGAPQARQVADRWHLLRNLGDALQKIADAHRRDIRAAWCAVSAQNPADHRHVPTRHILRHRDKKTLREQRYQEMKLLYHQGVPINEIARMVGLGHHTVSRWLKAGGPPAHDKPRQSRLLDPFETILEAQWLAGCRSGTKLWRGVQAEGFTGTARTVRRWTKHRAE